MATASRGLILGVGLALPLTAAITHTLCLPPRGDGVVIWFAKARALLEGVPFRDFPFVNYPDLGPAAWMLVLKWIGLEEESLGRAILPLAVFAWILALLEMFPRPRPWVAAIVLPVLAAATLDLEGATNGCQDFLVSAAAGVALVFILRLVSGHEPAASRRDGLLAAFFMVSLPLIKQEGFVLALLLGGAWLLAGRQLRTLLFTIPFLFVWPALQIAHGVNPTHVQGPKFSLGAVSSVFSNWERWPAIRPHFLAVLRVSAPLLCAFMILAAASAACLPKSRRATLALVTLLLTHTGFVLLVFFVTTFPLDWHLNTAFSRLYDQQRFVVVTGLAFMSVELFEAARRRGRSSS